MRRSLCGFFSSLPNQNPSCVPSFPDQRKAPPCWYFPPSSSCQCRTTRSPPLSAARCHPQRPLPHPQPYGKLRLITLLASPLLYRREAFTFTVSHPPCLYSISLLARLLSFFFPNLVFVAFVPSSPLWVLLWWRTVALSEAPSYFPLVTV